MLFASLAKCSREVVHSPVNGSCCLPHWLSSAGRWLVLPCKAHAVCRPRLPESGGGGVHYPCAAAWVTPTSVASSWLLLLAALLLFFFFFFFFSHLNKGGGNKKEAMLSTLA